MIDPTKPCVIDTNVLLAANKDAAEQVSPECAARCGQALNEIRKSGHVLVDDLGRMVAEYRKKTLRKNGQREAGDLFLLWLLQNLWVAEKCTRISLTPKPGDGENYEEFPDRDGLRDFDRSDRVFVAVANAHHPKARILQACDSDYWEVREELLACGIEVSFLCPDDMERIRERRGS